MDFGDPSFCVYTGSPHARLGAHRHLGWGVGGVGCQIGAGLWTTDMEQTFRVEAEPYQDDLHSLVFTPLGVDCRRCFCVCLGLFGFVFK